MSEQRKAAEKELAVFSILWQDQPGWREDSNRAMERVRLVNRMPSSRFEFDLILKTIEGLFSVLDRAEEW